jgi:hypothetical protein
MILWHYYVPNTLAKEPKPQKIIFENDDPPIHRTLVAVSTALWLSTRLELMPLIAAPGDKRSK